MSTGELNIQKPKVRLKFIDMARSIAILLMLEGHFVDDSLMDIYRDESNSIFYTWKFIRSFTAPMFLTVTGLIFVYLLLKTRDQRWIDSLRIRKGWKRVVELFFWGYLVQWYAFHVLECISVGIFTILIIYGLYKLTKVIPLWLYFFAAGVTAFALFPSLDQMPNGMGVPENVWRSALDIFHDFDVRKPIVLFPTAPFVGYTMFGAMIGALLHDFHDHVKKMYFPLAWAVIGVLFFFYPREILNWVDSAIDWFNPDWSYRFANLDWLFERLGMVIMELSALMFIDNLWGDRIRGNNLFLKVGQNTLTIYILHMVVLYGSIAGLGLSADFKRSLGPWEVTFGAAAFVLFFVALIYYLDTIKKKLSFILDPIKNFFNRIFFVN